MNATEYFKSEELSKLRDKTRFEAGKSWLLSIPAGFIVGIAVGIACRLNFNTGVHAGYLAGLDEVERSIDH